MFKKTMSVLALAGLALLGNTAAAQAATAPELTADPASIEVGAESTITASGLGGLETAGFGLGGGGMLIDPSTGQQSTLVEAPVTNGSATVGFTASEAGTFTVAVGDGETVLASTTVTVTAAAAPTTPTPEPTVTVTSTVTATPEPSPSETTAPAPVDAGFPGWGIWVIGLGVLLLAAIVVIVVLVVRRNRTGASTPPSS